MAIKWIDPYINASIGGIHGTVDGTTQNGTYAYPFPLSTSSGAGSASKSGLGLSNGDEVRIKGLAVDTFWGASTTFASVTLTDGIAANIQRYNVVSAHGNEWLRIKTIQTNRFLYLHSYSSQFNTSYASGVWKTIVPYLNQTFGSQLFDTDYELPSSTYIYLCSSGFSAGDNITITAGWINETTQGGETILATANKTFYPNVGQSGFNTNSVGNPLTINAPELSFLAGGGNIYGNDITLRTATGYEAAANPPTIYATGNITLQQNTAFWSTPNLRLYNYQSAGPAQSVLDVDFMSNQYYSDLISFHTNKSTASARWKFKLKEYYSQGSQANLSSGVPTPHTMDFELKASYHLASKGKILFSDMTELGTYTPGSSSLTNELSWYSSWDVVYFGEDVLQGQTDSAGANKSVLTPSTASNPTTDTSPFKQTSFGAHRAVFLAQLLNGSTSIETMDSTLGKIGASLPYGAPAKVTILADEQSNKPCQLMFSSNSTTVAYPVIINRSSSFADKLTWNFSSHTNAGIYAETFAISLPAIANLTFSCGFTTSTTPGVTIKAQLYTINSSGVDTGYGLQTAGVVGTAATISQTITSTTLTTNDAQSAYVIVEMTKTSAAVANVSIDSLGLS